MTIYEKFPTYAMYSERLGRQERELGFKIIRFLDGSSSLVEMGGDSCSEGRRFESQMFV